MKYVTLQYLSWSLVLLAVFVCAGVGYFAWTISGEESARVAKKADAESSSAQQEATIRLHALARETKEARQKLDAITRRDAIDILHEIEKVAKDAKIPIGIRQALTASSPDAKSLIRPVSFVVDAEGTFSEITRAVSLLESLSIPSLIDELEFQYLGKGLAGAGKSGPKEWRAVVHMRFFTTADISS